VFSIPPPPFGSWINKRTKDDPVSKHIAVQKACSFGGRNFQHETFFPIARNRSREFYKKFAKGPEFSE